MAKQAPDPIDIQDFQFKLHCRLKVFSNTDNNVFNTHCNLLANASRFGLIFIGTSSPNFQVIQIGSIESCSQKEGEINNYNCRLIPLPSLPKHLSVNCDNTKLAVVIERNMCPFALIYDVSSFFRQEISILQEIRLSTSAGVFVTETTWNPTIPNIFTACKSDGTLGLYELKETGIEINELPAESQALCICWSPKGKQIAVGSSNGKIVQYKPDLKATKSINSPPLDGSHAVVAIQWISSFQFIALYKSTNSETSSLVVVDAPKSGEVSFTNYEDICYSYGNVRPVQFYTIHQSVWNILMVASSNSMEVGVLGSEKEQWTQWNLADCARAELPLSSTKQETLPIGLAFDTSAVEPVIWGEHSLPPAPFLFLLSHYGVLCCFRIINIKTGASTICQAPEVQHPINSNLFTNTSKVEVKNSPLQAESPKENIAPFQSQFPQLSGQSKDLPTPVLQQPFSQPKDFPTPPIQQPAKDIKISPKVPNFSSVLEKPMFAPSSSLLEQSSSSQSTLTMKPTTIQTNTPTSSKTLSGSSQPSSAATIIPSNTQLQESKIMQETDIIISKLISEECEVLEKEIQALLRKGNSLKVELGTDPEAVQLVQDTDSIQNFLKEVIENSTVQADEVHSLKQGLIQTWAWFEDARSRYMQLHDATLDTLHRIQQLDPVSQRYLDSIQYLTYYLESQIVQATRVLDEQWENFQDSCKKNSKMKIPTIEKIYQTMVRQSAIHQKQKYVLKDIANRIRSHRSKMNGRSLIISLKNVDQLERDLLELQLDPENVLCAQYERVAETQSKLTSEKIQKFGKVLLEREITHISVNKPQLSNTLHSILNSSAQLKQNDGATVLGADLSPILINKVVPSIPHSTELIQSTPKLIPSRTEKKEINEELSKGLMSKIQPDSVTPNGIALPSGLMTGFAGSKVEPSTTKPFSFSTIPQSVPTSTSSFAFSFAPSTTTPTQTSTITISKVDTTPTTTTSQFIFGSSTSLLPSFTLTKSPASTTVKSSNTSNELSKSVQSTVSSAFVPTTQLAFTFTAKSSYNTTLSLNTNLSKPISTFTFPHKTPTAGQSDTLLNLTSKTTTPKTGTAVTLSTVSVTPISSFKSPTFVSAAPTPTALTVTPVSLQITSNKTPSSMLSGTSTSPLVTSSISLIKPTSTEKPSSIFSGTTAFNFSTVSTTENSIFTFKPAVSLATSDQPFDFSKVIKDSSIPATTASILPLVASTTTTPSGVAVVTSVKSVFSPVMTTSIVSTSVKTKDANSSSPSKEGSIFGATVAPTSTIFTAVTSSTTASMFPSIQTSSTPIVFKSAVSAADTATTNIFGTTSSTSTSSGSVFSSVTTPTSVPDATTTTTSSTFGMPVAATNSIFSPAVTSSNSVFSPTAFGAATTTSVFSQATTTVFPQSTTTTPSVFAQPLTTVSTAYTSKPFGPQTNFENSSAFDKPVFGNSPSLFGTATPTTTNIFGAPNPTAPIFGSSTPIFGNAPAATSGFSQQSSTFSFSAAAANIPNSESKFGFSKPTTFSFGNSQQNVEGNSFSFNSLNMGAASTTSSNPMNSTFGQSGNVNPFAKSGSQEPKPFGGGNLFGTPPSGSSTSIFGGASNSNSGFGTSPSFGSQPVFGGSPTFGQSPTFVQSTFGSSFGNPQSTGPFSSGNSQSVAQSGFGAFGQTQQKSPGFGGAPVFGSSPSGFGAPPSFASGGSAFGASPTFANKVFGESSNSTVGAFSGGNQQQSSTFANLANQNTLGFGALAQQSQQLPNQSPFSSSSSFSTWR